MNDRPKFSVEKLQHAVSMNYPKGLANTPASQEAWDAVFRELLGTLQELDSRIRAVAQESQLAIADLQARAGKPKKR